MTDSNKIPSAGTGTGSSVTSTSVNSRVIHYIDVFLYKKNNYRANTSYSYISQILIVYLSKMYCILKNETNAFYTSSCYHEKVKIIFTCGHTAWKWW